MKKVIIIGAGAAGLFAAVNIKEMNPDIEVEVLEAAAQPLRKVLISGGGRCNITNSFESGEPLSRIYPRGEKLMRSLLRRFDHRATREWFESRGLELVVQADGCLFPRSQSAAEVVDLLLRLAGQHGVRISTGQRVVGIEQRDGGFDIELAGGTKHRADVVLSTIGGQPRMAGMALYGSLPVELVAPSPSLFSMNIPSSSIRELMGAVVPDAMVSLRGCKLRAVGDLLITHWGVSGPAILKLSSYGALELRKANYRGVIAISWLGDMSEDALRQLLRELLEGSPRKLIASIRPPQLSARVWQHILSRADISLERRCAEIGSKGFNRIVATLLGDEYNIEGRASHREEFVTAGGVSLSSIDHLTLEARKMKGLYFAGECLDVDAITGGYNLQAAWSMGFVAAESIITTIRSESN